MSEDNFTREAALRLVQIGRPDEALRKLRENFDVDDPWSWYVRALALLRLDRYAESIEAANAGLAVDAEHVHLLDILAAARMATGDLKGAEEAILGALEIDAEDPHLLSRYAHVVARAGQSAKAEKLVLRALAIDPQNDYALQMNALLASASGDSRAAIARSRELLRHSPESPVAHTILGAAHIDSGRLDDAADHYAEAVRLDPTDSDVAEAARETRRLRHPLLWPLRPVLRFGAVPLWIAAVVSMYALRALKYDTAATWVAIVWVVYCIYTWVVPPLLRRFLR